MYFSSKSAVSIKSYISSPDYSHWHILRWQYLCEFMKLIMEPTEKSPLIDGNNKKYLKPSVNVSFITCTRKVCTSRAAASIPERNREKLMAPFYYPIGNNAFAGESAIESPLCALLDATYRATLERWKTKSNCPSQKRPTPGKC